MKNKILLIGAFLSLACTATVLAQKSENPYILQTFKDTRAVNTQSVETLPAWKLDVRIAHRFGDMFGEAGGWKSFYGLESASDVVIGAEFGWTDNFMFGLFRSKGSAANGLRQNLNTTVKYRILRQKKDDSMPISMSISGVGTASTQAKSTDPSAISSFPKFSHRFAYTAQLIVARKFSDRFSFQINPSFTHRNLVLNEDENDIISLGAAARYQVTKVMGILLDANYPFSSFRSDSGNGYYPAVGIGFEWDTGGHVFQLDFTNATGIVETDYIPYTQSNWAKGQFRMGFTIRRLFNL